MKPELDVKEAPATTAKEETAPVKKA